MVLDSLVNAPDSLRPSCTLKYDREFKGSNFQIYVAHQEKIFQLMTFAKVDGALAFV